MDTLLHLELDRDGVIEYAFESIDDYLSQRTLQT